MSRAVRRRAVPAILATCLLLLGASSVAAAESFVEGTVLVESGETVSGDLYAAAQTVVVNGRVEGDVIAAAQNVVINGHVEGSVNVASQTLTVDGVVGGAVRVAANEVQIAGSVDRDVVVFGNVLRISEPGTVRGDVGGGVAEVDVSGTVDGDVTATSRSMYVDGIVRGDVSVTVEELRIGPNAEIRGAVRYTSHRSVDQSPMASVGQVQRSEPVDAGAYLPDHPLVDFVGLTLGLTFLGFLFMFIRPIPSVALGETLRLRPLAALGVGVASWAGQFLALALLVVMAVLLGQLATAFAGAVVFLIVVATLVAILVALIAQVVVVLGVSRVLSAVRPRRAPSSPWAAYAVAAILVAGAITLAGLHPISGTIVATLTWIVGLGTVVLYQVRRRFIETHPSPAAAPQPTPRSRPQAPRLVGALGVGEAAGPPTTAVGAADERIAGRRTPRGG